MNDNILLVNEKLNQQEISRLLHTVGLGDNLKKSNLSFTDNVEKIYPKVLKNSFCKDARNELSDLSIG